MVLTPMARSTAWPETRNTMGAPRMVRRSRSSLSATTATVAPAHWQAARRSRLLGTPMQSSHVVNDDPAVVVDAGDAIDVVELEECVRRQPPSLLRFPRVEVEAEHRGGRGQAQIHQQEVNVAPDQGVILGWPEFFGLEHACGLNAFDDVDPDVLPPVAGQQHAIAAVGGEAIAGPEPCLGPECRFDPHALDGLLVSRHPVGSTHWCERRARDPAQDDDRESNGRCDAPPPAWRVALPEMDDAHCDDQPDGEEHE